METSTHKNYGQAAHRSLLWVQRASHDTTTGWRLVRPVGGSSRRCSTFGQRLMKIYNTGTLKEYRRIREFWNSKAATNAFEFNNSNQLNTRFHECRRLINSF